MTVEYLFRTCCGRRYDSAHAEYCVTLRRAAVEEALGHVESARAEIKAGDDNAAGGHLEMAARALMYHDALDNLRYAIEAGNRACDETVEGWPALAEDLTNDAHDQLMRWLLADVGKELDAPEPCECDQVQRLREERDELQQRLDEALAERDSARAWSNKHEGLAEHATRAVEKMSQSLAKARAEASAAKATIRRVEAERDAALQWGRDGARWSCERAQERDALQRLIRRCLAKVPEGIEHGGDLETAVDILAARQGSGGPSDAARDEVKELRRSLARSQAMADALDDQLSVAQDELDVALAMNADKEEYWQAFSSRVLDERDSAQGIVARCLDKMPRDIEHGGDLEKAVDQLLLMVAQTSSDAAALARAAFSHHKPSPLIRALRFAVNASADETGLSDEERNALAKMVRGTSRERSGS